uniref:Si:ch211-215c18.3 n=1 Tax=Sinocyclocheilus grahami TaxID=75366 RepID=A0A672K785_SINGR
SNYPSLHLFLDFNSWFWNTPRGPQMYSCITYIEKNLRVDCEFPETYNIPGPFCEYKQDGRLMGSTYPNTPVHMIPPIETRRRANVTLVPPNICRLTWMPMSDDRAYTYTCRVYQGSTWKENTLKLWLSCSIFVSLFQTGNLLVCSALTISFHTGLWMLAVVTSLPVALGLLHQAG